MPWFAKIMAMNKDQSDKVRNGQGFIAALDQSGGSTPKALKLYGVEESEYSGDAEMFDRIHEMRTRIIKSPSFTGDRVVAQTADGNIVRLDRADAFTIGRVAGRSVPCLSAQLQIAVHRGYEIREIDRDDIARLCAAAGLPLPPEYEGQQV